MSETDTLSPNLHPAGARLQVHLAPMQGYADNDYRLLHSELYGGIACYYTPFVRLEKGQMRAVDRRRLLEMPAGSAVPQIIFADFREFRTLVGDLKSLGFARIDLNLGCPYPMQTGRGRGAAMIANTAELEKIAAYISEDSETEYSVKTRLGLAEPAESMAMVEILNGIRLAHIAVHPRLASQMYKGELDLAAFGRLLEASRNPLIFNGDINTPADIDRVAERFPGIAAVMVGRGILARPSLAAEYLTEPWPRPQRMAALLEFHRRLLARYADRLCGPTQILQKIKPFWDYLEDEIGRKAHKAIRKSGTLPNYMAAVQAIEW